MSRIKVYYAYRPTNPIGAYKAHTLIGCQSYEAYSNESFEDAKAKLLKQLEVIKTIPDPEEIDL